MMTRILLFVTINLLALAATGFQDDGCEYCKTGVNSIFEMLKTVSVPGSIGVLTEQICPQMPEMEGCADAVGTWWPHIAQITFNDQSPKYVCQALDPNCTLFR